MRKSPISDGGHPIPGRRPQLGDHGMAGQGREPVPQFPAIFRFVEANLPYRRAPIAQQGQQRYPQERLRSRNARQLHQGGVHVQGGNHPLRAPARLG